MHQHSWQKSSHCGQGESCLYVAAHNGAVSLTESSDLTGAVLRTTPDAWATLVRALKAPLPGLTVRM